MKKNLKKVISAVIALALSASTFATVSFAKSFTDVANTASYAEAVDVLSGLGIINGYEDGTFGPDKTIKRSEAAKVIVAMVNKIETAEGRMGATKFDDVTADHWASGFINVGVADKFINGKSETRFDPDGEVKYNEIVKMIVSCLGYEEYAQFYGGYPTGYIAIADSEGITKGCSMDGDAAATRAVVAQLVYNALKTPVIQNKGMQYSAAQGGFVPNIQKQDGEESTYFKSLLTEKFDAYFVEGTVKNTKKTKEALDADEIEFIIKKTESYDNEDIIEIGKDSSTIVGFKKAIKVGETAAADYINTYANAIVQQTEDDEYVILSFVPSGKNKTATLDLGLLDDEEHTDKNVKSTILDSADPYIRLFASEDASKSTKYDLEVKTEQNEKPVTLYVNGVEETFNEDNVIKYIINNTVGVIELTDTYKSEDGYDIISVDYFATAQVKSVTAKKIYLESGAEDVNNIITSTIDLDTEENEELVYHIYYNDEEIAITDVKVGDVLSIQYNVKDTTNNPFYEIYVSRDTAEGKFSGLDKEDELATIAGERYSFVNYDKQDDVFYADNMGNEYKIFLDVFGRIFESEPLASTARYAILDKAVAQSSWDNAGVRLYLADGTYKNYELDSRCDYTREADIKGMIAERDEKGAIKLDENGDYVKKSVEERVVSYKISTTSGRITELVFPYERVTKAQAGKDDFENYKEGEYVRYTDATCKTVDKTNASYNFKFTGVKGEAEYKELTNGIGAIRMNSTTKIVNASDYKDSEKISDLTITTVDNLSEGVDYIVYGYGNKSQNAYPFVIITKGVASYTENTAFAVVASNMSSSSKDDGTEGFMVTLLHEGESKDMFILDDAEVDGKNVDLTSLSKGQVVMFLTDADGDIEEIVTIFDAKLESGYASLLKASLTDDYAQFIKLPVSGKPWTTKWDDTSKDNNVALLYGPVTKTDSGFFQIAQIASNKKTSLDMDVKWDGTTDKMGGTKDIYVNDSTNVYVFDYTKSKSQQFKDPADTTDADIIETFFAVVDETGAYDVVEWNADIIEKNPVNFAFAKVVDGTATDVFVILGDDDYVVKPAVTPAE